MIVFVADAPRDARRIQSRLEASAYLEQDAPRLSRLAASFLGDRRDVEDAVQETLEAAWRSWDTLRDQESRRSWLNTICVRRCLRVRRWRLRHRSIDLLDTIPSTDPASDADWDRVFSHLSVMQRVVIVLHFQHGFTLDECAALMGRHPGTVRQHLSRALARLRKEFNDG